MSPFVAAALIAIVVPKSPWGTEVTLALDYSDELGNLLQGYRRAYAARNDRFAQAFLRLNGSA